MADDPTGTPPPGGVADPPVNDPPADPPAGDPPAGDDLARMRAALRAANKEAETARLKLREIEDRDKTEGQKAADRATEAEKERDALKLDLLRHRIAAEKGLDLKLAARLAGTTEDEMKADADELLKLVKAAPAGGSFGGGPRGAAPTGGQDMNSVIRRAAGRT